MGTIQFTPTILKAAQILRKKLGYEIVTTPQAKPLSKTEVLGCTSPKLIDIDAVRNRRKKKKEEERLF